MPKYIQSSVKLASIQPVHKINTSLCETFQKNLITVYTIQYLTLLTLTLDLHGTKLHNAHSIVTYLRHERSVQGMSGNISQTSDTKKENFSWEIAGSDHF